jgi:hypothetical protein
LSVLHRTDHAHDLPHAQGQANAARTYNLKDLCMTSPRLPDPSPSTAMRIAQLERMEADLARIVGPQGSRALLARSKQMCAGREPSCALLVRNLLQQVRKLLGKPLARWLLHSASAVPHTEPDRMRLH